MGTPMPSLSPPHGRQIFAYTVSRLVATPARAPKSVNWVHRFRHLPDPSVGQTVLEVLYLWEALEKRLSSMGRASEELTLKDTGT